MNRYSETRALRLALSAGLALMLCLTVLTGSAFTLKAYADYEPPQALKTLWELNHDVIGGLSIPGTAVNYPIMQSATDDYYLNVCFDGTAGLPGSVYVNKVDGKTFDTFNTVVYGRNMADGSYFGGLNKYLDVEYLDAHREIVVYGVNAKHTYQVFAVVVYDDRRITDTYTDGDWTSGPSCSPCRPTVCPEPSCWMTWAWTRAGTGCSRCPPASPTGLITAC